LSARWRMVFLLRNFWISVAFCFPNWSGQGAHFYFLKIDF
jgi:hypothetical protein